MYASRRAISQASFSERRPASRFVRTASSNDLAAVCVGEGGVRKLRLCVFEEGVVWRKIRAPLMNKW